MKLIAPTYYTAFRCVAGDCKHSCCSGFDIGIDDVTAAIYKTFDGPLGDRLHTHIRSCDDGYYMQTLDDGRCPFLNKQGLCDIIIEKGEDALCQICRDHPRFRNELSDRTEIGLGLCCEAAARLIVTQVQPFSLSVIDNDGEEEFPEEDEADFLSVRNRLLLLATDRSLPLCEREERLLSEVGHSRAPLSAAQFAALYRPLERLDPAWDNVLDTACDDDLDDAWDIPFEQILCYFLYRHITIDNVGGAVAFAVQSTRFLKKLFAAADKTIDALCELCRAYSAEIEYSDENIDELLFTF